ncbi:MAG: efflux RND transporter periplasmic adaptor subunit [Candidatus Acidiferrales bacterium]
MTSRLMNISPKSGGWLQGLKPPVIRRFTAGLKPRPSGNALRGMGSLRDRKYRALLAALFCVAAAVPQIGCESQKTNVEAPPIPVTVAEVQEYSGAEGVNYSASIVPYTQLPVAFKSAGYVTSILQRKGADGRVRNLQQGDWVKQGAVLATVRQTDYEHAVAQYKGQLQQAQAGADKSKEDFARAQALYTANALTQTDYDSAKAQFDSSQGSVTTAQAAVAQAQQALSDCELRAPMDGQILQRNIELGALVASGTTGFTMGDTRVVKAIFGVPDTVLGSIALGKKQAIETETYSQQFTGLITAVAPQADQKSRTFQVEVTVQNPQDLLKSGMIATLILGQSKLATPVLVVPLNAIVSTVDGSRAFSVFVAGRDGAKDVARRRLVQTGPAFGNNVAIVKGLSPGDRVILDGATLVNEGQVVRIIP